MKKQEKLTQKRLKELLHYDPETGVFRWKKYYLINKGKYEVGSISKQDGYCRIHIKGKTYLAQRLAWLYVYGYFPENELDHKDQIKHHNWISNLKEASRSCNMRNTKNQINNTSGVKGVSPYKNSKKISWMVSITISTKQKYLGLYKSFDEAVCVRLAAEQCLDWSNCNSNSPAYLYVQNMLKKKKRLPKIII